MSPPGITPVIPHSFADCEASYEEARYVLVGVPYDGTTSFRPGTRSGPRAIREISYNFESYIPEYHLALDEIPVHDLGDLDTPAGAGDVVALVEDTVRKIRGDGKIPVILGGEHTATVGAARAMEPEIFVVCDAHLDLRSEYRGQRYNHACSTRLVYEEGVHEIFILGARSGTAEQFAFAEQLHLYTPTRIRERGIGTVLREIAEFARGRDLYLSVDADAIDCCITPGLGTPEPFGLTPDDIRAVIAAIGPLSGAFDYMEVCPCDSGQTACVAAQLIREFIAAHWSAQPRCP
jgi:agmatinase